MKGTPSGDEGTPVAPEVPVKVPFEKEDEPEVSAERLIGEVFCEIVQNRMLPIPVKAKKRAINSSDESDRRRVVGGSGVACGVTCGVACADEIIRSS